MASTGMTSYERIYHKLFETSTCKDVWNAALKDLDGVKIEEVTWGLDQGPDTAEAKATFHFTGGFAWGANHVASSGIRAETFLTRELVKKIVDVHFGSDKDVKTSNCSESVVRHGGTVSREGGKDYQDDFHDFLTRKFTKEADAKMQEATQKLRADVKAMEATNEFKQARREALVGFCKETITKALLPWHEMEQQVLQDAWDQFICTAIMRT